MQVNAAKLLLAIEVEDDGMITDPSAAPGYNFTVFTSIGEIYYDDIGLG